MSLLIEKRQHFPEMAYITMAIVWPLHGVQIVRCYLVECIVNKLFISISRARKYKAL